MVTETLPKDCLNLLSNMINMAVKRGAPKFTNTNNIVGQLYTEGAFVFNYTETIPYKYTAEFTICFWAKFIDKGHIDEAFPNSIKLVLNDNSVISAPIPSGITQTDYNWYKVQRDKNNLISFYVNNTLIYSATSSVLFDLSDKSYLFLGNQNRYFTGYDVLVDDILLFESCVPYTDTLPTTYLDLVNFVKLLYIKSSDGSVWGMRESV